MATSFVKEDFVKWMSCLMPFGNLRLFKFSLITGILLHVPSWRIIVNAFNLSAIWWVVWLTDRLLLTKTFRCDQPWTPVGGFYINIAGYSVVFTSSSLLQFNVKWVSVYLTYVRCFSTIISFSSLTCYNLIFIHCF